MRLAYVRTGTTTIALLIASACHDGTGPARAVAPRELEIASGGVQSSIRGDDAHSPLRVHVVGTDGKPFAGADIRWTTQGRAATIDPPITESNSAGDAMTRAEELAIIGPIHVVASLPGVPSVSFEIDAGDPCVLGNARAIRVDRMGGGVLRPIDCQIDGLYFDFYQFTLAAGRAVTVHAVSDTFDPLVFSFDAASGLGWGGKAARPHSGETAMRAILPPGPNAIAVAELDPSTLGEYSFSVLPDEEDVTRCEEILVARNITTQQHLQSLDCHDHSETQYHDEFFLFLWEGQSVSLTEWAPGFTPRLSLRNAAGIAVARAAGTGTTPARITFSAPASAYYVIAASSVEAGASGSYRLDVRDASAASLTSPVRGASAGASPWRPAARMPRN
ncbi:MAG TPA: hypothetical protein VFN39_04250 [Gemmatimonadaceae bacterium]|nr:hypothetical protein [Gemmatimonadaceae bacterium]